MKHGTEEYYAAERKEILDVLHRLDIFDIRWITAHTSDATLKNYADSGLVLPPREKWLMAAIERRFQLQHGFDAFAEVDES